MGVATFRRLHERQRALKTAAIVEAMAPPPVVAEAPPVALTDEELERATAPARKPPPVPARR